MNGVSESLHDEPGLPPEELTGKEQYMDMLVSADERAAVQSLKMKIAEALAFGAKKSGVEVATFLMTETIRPAARRKQ